MTQYVNGNETKNQIIEASSRLFLKKGIQNTSFTDIAKEAHVNQGSIYYHFRKKSELVQEVIALEHNRNMKIIARIMPDHASPFMELSLYYIYYWYRFFKDPKFCTFMSMPSNNMLTEISDNSMQQRTLLPFLSKVCMESDKYRRISLALATSMDYQLSLYIGSHLAEYTWDGVALYEINLFAKILGLDSSEVSHAAKEAVTLVKDQDRLAPRVLCCWQEDEI